jgi:hypothetical protein
MNSRSALILGLAFVMAALIHGGVYGMVVAGSADSGIVAFQSVHRVSRDLYCRLLRPTGRAVTNLREGGADHD